MPVGFKNSTDGNVDVAINSIHSAAEPKVFMGVTQAGCVAAIHTKGNPHCFLVLRGGVRENYSYEDVAKASNKLSSDGIETGIVVDASHGNSGKDWERQIEVLQYLATSRHSNVRGIMVESFLEDGRQNLSDKPLVYGKSVTDSCIGWSKTENIITNMHSTI